jgi:hypothetical protein
VLEDFGISYAETTWNRDNWEEDKLVYTKYPFSQGASSYAVLLSENLACRWPSQYLCST